MIRIESSSMRYFKDETHKIIVGEQGLGEVRKPDDFIHRRRKPIPDLTPTPIPQPTSLKVILQQIQSMKADITKIKQALRAHGITI